MNLLDSSDFRVAFYIGNFPIYWYAIFIFLGIIISSIGTWYTAKLKKVSTKPLENVLFIVIPAAIVGARIWYIVGDIGQFDTFWSLFDLRKGGIAIEGALMGSILAGYFWFRWQAPKYNMRVIQYFDVILPNILFGQILGRWGNFFNQEVLGYPSNLWNWLPPFIRDHLHLVSESSSVVRTPLFLIEGFFNFWILMFIFFVLPKLNWLKIDGYAGASYLIGYGVLRAILENFRYEKYIMTFFGVKWIRLSVLTSIIFIGVGVGIIIYKTHQFLTFNLNSKFRKNFLRNAVTWKFDWIKENTLQVDVKKLNCFQDIPNLNSLKSKVKS
ncbi:prolipoprotein diacylglyceryl transferase [Mycoplasma sp. SG1]|uniref:prolipoprotein diacylglyceryl transferase n=1 Tax=Mycoplasma sp. SG1 TaxID=2810348 RepID=UPI0020255777|nr:prolipoprotein diacylglyceryl transferase [Mycoplasma sp. SG1]URM53002.1 prolipoprotein diacylglyceryl transferase [Mycoplasma sp. SG1]